MTDTVDLAWPFAAKVHQAEGVLSARHSLSIDEAAQALRARANTTQRTLLDVALDVLNALPVPTPRCEPDDRPRAAE